MNSTPAATTSLEGRHYVSGQPIRVTLKDDRIDEVEPAEFDDAAELPWIGPGLFDLQVNGLRGISFTSPTLTPDDVAQASHWLAATGVTRYLPTVTTAPEHVLQHALATLGACRRKGTTAGRAAVAGIHLEGPYLSAQDGPRGAHPRSDCQRPDWNQFQRWQECSGDAIVLITLAPELDGALEFIEQATDAGVTVALGHHQASAAQLDAAVRAGATLATHLGNGAHAVLPRHPNYIWEQLADDRLAASVIVDGHHLPECVVRTFVRAKPTEKLILVSDITSLAGQPPGRYDQTSLGSVDVLEDGRLVVAGQQQYLAGASDSLLRCLQNLAQIGEMDLGAAWSAASSTPANLLGQTSGLAAGQPADLLLLPPQIPGKCRSQVRPWPQPQRWSPAVVIASGQTVPPG